MFLSLDLVQLLEYFETVGYITAAPSVEGLCSEFVVFLWEMGYARWSQRCYLF